MKFWVGVTDKGWFEHLSRLRPDEVNFWQPGATPPTRQLQPGDLFLFKLHSPDNYVVGGGFYVRFTQLPARLAWEAFGRSNGVESYGELLARLKKYRRADGPGDPEIGCNILNAPFFLPREQWIPIPEDWKSSIVRGKTYESGEHYGAQLYDAVWAAMGQQVPVNEIQREQERYSSPYLTRARLGQGTFRILVTDAYHRRCAVTGEKTLPVLEAAHIRPFAEEGPNHVNNGLLLRADLHRLFDSGYVTVDPDLRFVVSGRIKEDYENGRDYYALQGKQLSNVPESPLERPSRAQLAWHNENAFRE